jgi:hypothetical protein
LTVVKNELNRFEFMKDDAESETSLGQYLQSLDPETIAQLSRPQSSEVMHVMERNIIGLLGALPPENFDVTITTNREQLGRLLASAMMGGYFIRNAEQRMGFERSLQSLGSDLSGGEFGGSEDDQF